MNPTTSNYNPSTGSNTGLGGGFISNSTPSSSASAIQSLYSNPSWRFSSEELLQIPSLKDGFTPDQELKMRQQAAVFIQEMGDRLNSTLRDPNPSGRGKITQFSMCVAMVHLHRFFVIHSMRTFDPRDVAAACLFLAGKGEECPRKLEHIVNVWFRLKNRSLDRQIELDRRIVEQCSEYIVLLESIVLQTIGFILQVDLPHPLILAEMNKHNKANPLTSTASSRSLTETAYYFATDILMVTDWCVRYSMKTLACVCIQIVNIWSQYEIPLTESGVPWFKMVDPELTQTLLLDLANKFSVICTSDKAHFSKKAAERQAGLGHRSGQSTSSNPQQQTPIAGASRCTTPKLLPPPPVPPSLASNATGPSPKRKHEGNGNETIKSEVGTPPSKIFSNSQSIISTTFVKKEMDANFVDEWALQATLEEEKPVKQKKKLGLSEYKERMSSQAGQANGAMSASSDGGASSEAEVMSSTSSTGAVQQMRVVNSPKINLEEVKPRRSFMPDISKAAELVSSDAMQLPAGIIIAEPKKKPVEKRRDSTSSKHNSNPNEKPSGNHVSQHPRPSSRPVSSHQQHQQPKQVKPVAISSSSNGSGQAALQQPPQPQSQQPSSSDTNNLPYQVKTATSAQNRQSQQLISSYKSVPPIVVERTSFDSNPTIHRLPVEGNIHKNSSSHANPQAGPYFSSRDQSRYTAAKSQQYTPQPSKQQHSGQQQHNMGGYCSPPSPMFESISPPQEQEHHEHYQHPQSSRATHPRQTHMPYACPHPQQRMLTRPQGPNHQFQKKYQSYSNELEDGELT